MRFIKTFEAYNEDTLIIVDVQKSFRKFFSEMYLNELKKYSKNFNNVYQIWDNHIDGKNVDKEYLYDINPTIPIHDDLFYFPNQKDIIEKRYNYKVDADFYKKILDSDIYEEISKKEEEKTLKKGDVFPTKEGTIITFINNNHVWFHCPKKLYELLIELKGRDVVIVGGADSECLEDIVTTAESLDVKIKRNYKFIYTASSCPIK
jgi:hypothetical protein